MSIFLFFTAAAALAASPPVDGTVIRLSAAEAENALEAAARRNAALPQVEAEVIDGPDRTKGPLGDIHGEVGFGIGTNGYREIFGQAHIPLGEDGMAAFSFDRARFGGYRPRRPR